MSGIVSLFSKQSEEITLDRGRSLVTYTSEYSSKETFSSPKWLKYLAVRMAMTPLYPSQSTLLSLFNNSLRCSYLDNARAIAVENLFRKGFTARRIILDRNGEKYDGITVYAKNSAVPSQWILQVSGRSCSLENSIEDIADYYLRDSSFGLFMVNGPAIGRSQGVAFFQTMALTQRLAIRYLEEKIQATHIALVGHSFGGAILGLALIGYPFREDICYLVIRQMSFGKLSELAENMTGIAMSASLIKALDLEIDENEASEYLDQKGIIELVFQATRQEGVPISSEDFISDGAIDGSVSLGNDLIKQNWVHKRLIGLGRVGHAASSLWKRTRQEIQRNWEKSK